MLRLFLISVLALMPLATAAGPLDEYLWQNRVIIVFADSPLDPRFVQQMENLDIRPEDLEERDVVILTDTEADGSALRDAYRPRGFMLVVVGKDGTVALRKPSPLTVRELVRSIDKMPMRIEEIGRSR